MWDRMRERRSERPLFPSEGSAASLSAIFTFAEFRRRPKMDDFVSGKLSIEVRRGQACAFGRGFLFPAPASHVTWVHGWNAASGLPATPATATIMPGPAPTTQSPLHDQRAQPVQRGRGGELHLRSQRQPDVGRHQHVRLRHREPAGRRSGNVTLRYDPLGRLYEVAAPSGTMRFLYCGDALVNEYGTDGMLHHRYAHGANPGADDPLVWYGGGTMVWLHSDHQGSITGFAHITGNTPRPRL